MSSHSEIENKIYILLYGVERNKEYPIKPHQLPILEELANNWQPVFKHYNCQLKISIDKSKMMIQEPVL
jgi:hypothetical protein